MSFLASNVGRKVIMAVTGLFLVLFVMIHLLGNTTVFFGPNGINAYGEHLHSLPPLVWGFRAVMLPILAIHIFFGITLTLENWRANPGKYAVARRLKVTFSSRTMIWTGLLLLGFIGYHILQFTARVTPDIVQGVDAAGRYDVFRMVASSFGHLPISAVYVASMIVLFLHLSHGIQSVFQSLGANNDRYLPRLEAVGKVVSAVFLVGFSSIPVLFLAGILAR